MDDEREERWVMRQRQAGLLCSREGRIVTFRIRSPLPKVTKTDKEEKERRLAQTGTLTDNIPKVPRKEEKWTAQWNYRMKSNRQLLSDDGITRTRSTE